MSKRTDTQALIAALPGTVAQIVQKSGIGRSTVYTLIAQLRKSGDIHIAAWRRTTGLSKPTYAAGQGIDKPRPAARSGAQYNARYYAKHRRVQEKELRDVRKAALLNAAVMATRPQSWLSALGVAAA